MSFRQWLASKLDPDAARRAWMHDWLVNEIWYEARWLAEFPHVSRTLERLLSLKKAHFRPLDEESTLKEERDISLYREVLRASDLRPKHVCPRMASVMIDDCAAHHGGEVSPEGVKCRRCGKVFT